MHRARATKPCIYSRLPLGIYSRLLLDSELLLLFILKFVLIRILPTQVLRFDRMDLECAQGEDDDTLHLFASPFIVLIFIHICTYMHPTHMQVLRFDREDASSMVTAGVTANTTVKNSRASRESGLLCSHSHGESIGLYRMDLLN